MEAKPCQMNCKHLSALPYFINTQMMGVRRMRYDM